MPNSKPPNQPRDPLGETWPEDPEGVSISDKQIDYLLRHIERLEKNMPTEEDLAFLQRKREEDEHARWIVKQVKQHFPWIAVLSSAIASGVYYLMTHSITISNKQ